MVRDRAWLRSGHRPPLRSCGAAPDQARAADVPDAPQRQGRMVSPVTPLKASVCLGGWSKTRSEDRNGTQLNLRARASRQCRRTDWWGKMPAERRNEHVDLGACSPDSQGERRSLDEQKWRQIRNASRCVHACMFHTQASPLTFMSHVRSSRALASHMQACSVFQLDANALAHASLQRHTR